MKEYKDCRLIKVVDGDTFDAYLPFEDKFLRIVVYVERRIRLARIGCPENDTPEGKTATACTEQILSGQVRDHIRIEILGKDRYGRLVSEVFLDEENLSDKLLEKGTATPYLAMTYESMESL